MADVRAYLDIPSPATLPPINCRIWWRLDGKKAHSIMSAKMAADTVVHRHIL